MKKILAVLICAMLAVGIAACAQDTANQGGEADEAVYGKVISVKENEAIIALGTVEEGERPEMPSGETPPDGEPSGDAMPEGEEEPEMPNGETPPTGEINDGGLRFTEDENGTQITIDLAAVSISKQEGDGEAEGTADDLAEGTIVKMEGSGEGAAFVPKKLTVVQIGAFSKTDSEAIELSGILTVDGTSETADAQGIVSAAADENAVLVKNGGSLELNSGTVEKTGDTSDEEASNFYALNAVIAATSGSTAEIADSSVHSAANGANAIFATGEGAVIRVDNVSIHTEGDSSRGLDATYGGTVNAANVEITTEGAHCAPIATDRGEGTITVETGTVSAAGEGSPCIYSTGEITVNNVIGTAFGSQAAVVEGKNSITMTNSDLTGAGENGIMLYQSTSGDAAEGTARFDAKDSKITATSDGPMIYVTNTEAEATFENTELVFESGILADIAGNETNNWGTPGLNGGKFTLTGIRQVFRGNVTCDEISTFSLALTQGSVFEGAVNAENRAQEATVSLDKESTWTLTGDSYITVLTNEDATCSNISSGGYCLYYDADAAGNEWLNGQTIPLAGGGNLTPAN